MRHKGKLTEWNEAPPPDTRQPEQTESAEGALPEISTPRIPTLQRTDDGMRHRRCVLRNPGSLERSGPRANAAHSGIRAAERDHLRHVRHRQGRSREGQKAYTGSHAALRWPHRRLARSPDSTEVFPAQNQEAAVSGHILVWGGGELWGVGVACLYRGVGAALGWFRNRLTETKSGEQKALGYIPAY